MSRIGKSPIPLPDKVSVSLNGLDVTVKGPKGELKRTLPDGVTIIQVDNTLVANMVEGVSTGFSKKLEIVGVGNRAQVKGKNLVVSAGYSHPVEMIPPDGITFAVENNTNVTVSGTDKELVGNEAAKIRAIRPPEPYKGKGIKYAGERIMRKAGKSGKK